MKAFAESAMELLESALSLLSAALDLARCMAGLLFGPLIWLCGPFFSAASRAIPDHAFAKMRDIINNKWSGTR